MQAPGRWIHVALIECHLGDELPVHARDHMRTPRTSPAHISRAHLPRTYPEHIAHAQVVEDGYEFTGERTLVTVFSAPNYCGEFDNCGAMMSIDEDLCCSFQARSTRDAPEMRHRSVTRSSA